MASLAIARPRVLQNYMSVRARLEASIEAAIAALDQLDGDSDLEDSFDREIACEDEGAPEYSTCSWPDGEVDQTKLCARPWGA